MVLTLSYFCTGYGLDAYPACGTRLSPQAFYLAVTSGVTVGYGDFSPYGDGTNTLNLMLGVCYVLVSNIVLGASIGLLVSSVATADRAPAHTSFD